MAEQLGQAVLTVSADTRQLEAGLQRARQQAEQTGQALGQAFSGSAAGPASAIRSIQALQQKLQGLRASYETVQIGSKGFRDLQREIQRTERELQKVDNTLGATFAQRAGGFGAGLLGALGVGVGIGAGAALGGFLKESIQQAIELETVSRKLSNTLGQQGAAGALNFTKGLANDLGLSFKTLSDSFARFTAAATAANVPLETQRNLFAAVSRAGQSLGLSNDEINGSFLALQQIASKGVVSFEELRQQLGERLPIALSATAKGLGISQQELIKLVESGKLTASQFFPALTKGLNELTAGSGGLETTAQKFGKFRNAWENLQASFGQNLLPSVTQSVEALTAALEGLRAEQAGRELQKLFDLPLNDAITLSAQLQQLQKEYNLSDATAQRFLKSALQDAGGSRNIFGQLSLSGKQFSQVQLQLIDLAAKFRAANPDQLSAAQSAAARKQQELEKEQKITAQKQKQFDLDLKRDQAALQLASSQSRLEAAGLTPSLDEAGRIRLQNELSLNEKIREVEATRLALQRELAKPKGTGDGKPTAGGAPTQNQNTINDLQGQLDRGRVDVAALRLQNQQADAAALRNQQERIRGQALERDNAFAKLRATQQQTQLERQALVSGLEVSRTTQLRLQQEQSIGAAKRQQQAAQQALNAELRKPKDQQDAVVLDDLFGRVNRANNDVRQAYADAGLSLVQNARSAADALKSAQQSFNSSLQGNFDLLTGAFREQALSAARNSVNRGISAGIIDPSKVNFNDPQSLFRAAQASEQLVNAQQQLQQAITENAAATQRLADKRWDVFVSVPGQPTFVPLSNV